MVTCVHAKWEIVDTKSGKKRFPHDHLMMPKTETKKRLPQKVGVDGSLSLKVKNLHTIKMRNNVGVIPNKSKSLSHSRTTRRLVGWMKRRISRSSKPWIAVKLDDFCGLTGVTIRTARRCVNAVRNDPESDIVLRTCYENRKWSLLASTTSRLHGLKRSEPFDQSNEGKRIVKTKMCGEVVRVEQLRLGREGVLWGEEPNYTIPGCLESQPEEDPNQEVMNFDAENGEVDLEKCWENFLKPKEKVDARQSDISLVSNRRVSVKTETKSNTTQRVFGDGTHRLAFAIARNYLEPIHYDNCKIAYEPKMAFCYARRALKNGCTKQDIIRCYDWALHDCHAMCVDIDPLTSAGGWRASSTIHRAERLLVARRCHGKWKRVTAQQKVVEVI
jgi:hypothetical protein